MAQEPIKGNVDEKIQYQTKFGLIAGVTPVIDKYYTIMGSLGERFLKLRRKAEENQRNFMIIAGK